MPSNFIKLMFLNFWCFYAIFYPSWGWVNIDRETALRDMVHSSGGQHKWQVVGWDKANVMDFPFQSVVVVTNKNKKPIVCSGAIVSKTILLTSATCVCDLRQVNCPVYDLNLFTVYTDSKYRWNLIKNAAQYKVYKIIKHPDFDKQRPRIKQKGKLTDVKHDMAVIKVKGYFSYSKYTAMIMLADKSWSTKIQLIENSDLNCTVFGWNTITTVANKPARTELAPIQLVYAKMKFISFKECQRRLSKEGYSIHSNIHICAIGYNDSICTGETGGGLVCVTGDDDRYIVGVASKTLGCGSESLPNVFTRVDTSSSFIKKLIMEEIKFAQSSGVFIHNQIVAQYYGAPLTSVLLVTRFIKSGF